MKDHRKERAEARKKAEKLSGNAAARNYTYILKCGDGSLYTGWTNDIAARLEQHRSGKGAKYTKSRKPVKLVYFETFLTKQEAMRREWEIKQLSRVEKWKLIQAKKQ